MCKYRFIYILNRLFFFVWFYYCLIGWSGLGGSCLQHLIHLSFLTRPGMVPDTHKEGTKPCYLNLGRFHLQTNYSFKEFLVSQPIKRALYRNTVLYARPLISLQHQKHPARTPSHFLCCPTPVYFLKIPIWCHPLQAGVSALCVLGPCR